MGLQLVQDELATGIDNKPVNGIIRQDKLNTVYCHKVFDFACGWASLFRFQTSKESY